MKNAFLEYSESEIVDLISGLKTQDFALYFYTPLCGTCKLAEQMLSIATNAGKTIPIYKINANFAPKLIDQFSISSIPCIKIFRDNNLKQTIYALNSVQEIYASIKL